MQKARSMMVPNKQIIDDFNRVGGSDPRDWTPVAPTSAHTRTHTHT